MSMTPMMTKLIFLSIRSSEPPSPCHRDSLQRQEVRALDAIRVYFVSEEKAPTKAGALSITRGKRSLAFSVLPWLPWPFGWKPWRQSFRSVHRCFALCPGWHRRRGGGRHRRASPAPGSHAPPFSPCTAGGDGHCAIRSDLTPPSQIYPSRVSPPRPSGPLPWSLGARLFRYELLAMQLLPHRPPHKESSVSPITLPKPEPIIPFLEPLLTLTSPLLRE